MELRDYIITGEVYNKVKEMTKEELMKLDMFEMHFNIEGLKEELEQIEEVWVNCPVPARFKEEIINECRAIYNEEIRRIEEVYRKNERIQLEREAVKHRLETDEEYRSKLCIYSDKLKVIAEIFNSRGKLWGYLVQNFSNEKMSFNNSLYDLEAGEIKELKHSDFIRWTCHPEIAFKLLNGKVQCDTSFEDMDDYIELYGIEEALKHYQFVPFEDEEEGIFSYKKTGKKQPKNSEKTV